MRRWEDGKVEETEVERGEEANEEDDGVVLQQRGWDLLEAKEQDEREVMYQKGLDLLGLQ